MKPADAKLQRLIDLIAALLTHRYGVTFSDLKRFVPAYGRANDHATLARMFERDKDELRAHGLHIGTTTEETHEGTTTRYHMRAKDVYLPFLTLTARPASTRSVPPAGYRDVPTVAFEPDELSAVLRAAHQAKAVGDPALARDAESVIHKLLYDVGLALGSAVGEAEEYAARVVERDTSSALRVLAHALLRRKIVTFTYRSMNRDATEARTVEPYGLAFTGGHWYLVGRDVPNDALRRFRVSRMKDVRANAKRPQSADYETPRDFDLAAHGQVKDPWELGDEAPQEMIVEIRAETGAALAVRNLGAAVEGAPNQRRFQVRRVDSFVRWLMSFAGDVVPVSPALLCEQYHTVVSATLAQYGEVHA